MTHTLTIGMALLGQLTAASLFHSASFAESSPKLSMLQIRDTTAETALPIDTVVGANYGCNCSAERLVAVNGCEAKAPPPPPPPKPEDVVVLNHLLVPFFEGDRVTAYSLQEEGIMTDGVTTTWMASAPGSVVASRVVATVTTVLPGEPGITRSFLEVERDMTLPDYGYTVQTTSYFPRPAVLHKVNVKTVTVDSSKQRVYEMVMTGRHDDGLPYTTTSTMTSLPSVSTPKETSAMSGHKDVLNKVSDGNKGSQPAAAQAPTPDVLPVAYILEQLRELIPGEGQDGAFSDEQQNVFDRATIVFNNMPNPAQLETFLLIGKLAEMTRARPEDLASGWLTRLAEFANVGHVEMVPKAGRAGRMDSYRLLYGAITALRRENPVSDNAKSAIQSFAADTKGRHGMAARDSLERLGLIARMLQPSADENVFSRGHITVMLNAMSCMAGHSARCKLEEVKPFREELMSQSGAPTTTAAPLASALKAPQWERIPSVKIHQLYIKGHELPVDTVTVELQAPKATKTRRTYDFFMGAGNKPIWSEVASQTASEEAGQNTDAPRVNVVVVCIDEVKASWNTTIQAVASSTVYQDEKGRELSTLRVLEARPTSPEAPKPRITDYWIHVIPKKSEDENL